jgi:NhaP-type Na+/H+ or K+/H+ antiporter
MTRVTWFVAAGLVLLCMALLAGRLKRLPLSSSIIYLAVGVLLGPMMADQFHVNALKLSGPLELVTEVAVLLSVFAAGLKVPAPLGHRVWLTPFRLATVSMTLTVALVAAAGMLLLDLPLGAAVLLGAILAPTDPVLAHDIQVSGPGDRNHLRFSLTAEAGLNDGAAFPLVMLGLGLLGLHELGGNFTRWLTVDLLWACSIAIAAGGLLGTATAWFTRTLTGHGVHSVFTEDFLALGLVALTNGLALLIGGYGFLAVFAAGYMLRRSEIHWGPLIEPPTEPAGQHQRSGAARPETYISEVSLSFIEQIERLSEVALLILIGGMLFRNSWQLEYVWLALALLVVIRPLSVFVGLIGDRASTFSKATIG